MAKSDQGSLVDPDVVDARLSRDEVVILRNGLDLLKKSLSRAAGAEKEPAVKAIRQEQFEAAARLGYKLMGVLA